jgi:sugar lactone lactonase YvrE
VAGAGFQDFSEYAGFSSDGGAATNAELSNPQCVAIDTLGNLFFTDQANNRVRKVDTNGMITTVAGNGTGGFSGDGGVATNAEINSATGVAVDTAGNLYIADSGNEVIRKVALGEENTHE